MIFLNLAVCYGTSDPSNYVGKFLEKNSHWFQYLELIISGSYDVYQIIFWNIAYFEDSRNWCRSVANKTDSKNKAIISGPLILLDIA